MRWPGGAPRPATAWAGPRCRRTARIARSLSRWRQPLFRQTVVKTAARAYEMWPRGMTASCITFETSKDGGQMKLRSIAVALVGATLVGGLVSVPAQEPPTRAGRPVPPRPADHQGAVARILAALAGHTSCGLPSPSN